VQRPDLLAGGQRGVGGVGRGPGALGVEGDDRARPAGRPARSGQVRLEQLARRHLPLPHEGGQLGGRAQAEVVVAGVVGHPPEVVTPGRRRPVRSTPAPPHPGGSSAPPLRTAPAGSSRVESPHPQFTVVVLQPADGLARVRRSVSS
jgi:hypothetical protein